MRILKLRPIGRHTMLNPKSYELPIKNTVRKGVYIAIECKIMWALNKVEIKGGVI